MLEYRFVVLTILQFVLIFPSLTHAEEQKSSYKGKSGAVMSLGSGIGLKYKYMLGETVALSGGIRYLDSQFDSEDLDFGFSNSSNSNTLGYLLELRKYTAILDTRYFFDIEFYYAEYDYETISISQLTNGTRTTIRNTFNDTLGITLAFGLEHFLKENLSIEARAGIRYSIDDRTTDMVTTDSTTVTTNPSKADGDSWGFPVIAIGITKYW